MAIRYCTGIGLFCLATLLVSGCSHHQPGLDEYTDLDAIKQGVDRWVHVWDQTRLTLESTKYVVDADKDPLDRNNWTINPVVCDTLHVEACIATPQSWRLDIQESFPEKSDIRHDKYSWHDAEFRSMGGIGTDRQALTISPKGAYTNGIMLTAHFLTPPGIRFFETPFDLGNILDAFSITIQNPEIIDGHRCIHLYGTRDRYQLNLWLDPQNQFIMRKARLEAISGDTIDYYFEYVLKDTQLLDDIPIPSHAIYYLHSTQLAPEHGIRVREWFLKSATRDKTIQSEDIPLNATPGTYVFDIKKGIQYKINDKGEREKVEKLRDATTGCCGSNTKCTKPASK